MRILLFGKNGQSGSVLLQKLQPLGDLIALSSQSTDCCGDLANPDGIRQTIRAIAPDIIVNASAYTSVDLAETESAKARLLNATSPAAIAEEAQKCGALVIHYSTDYVFNGEGLRPWIETDLTAPLNTYGTTKLDGENAIRQSGCRHIILRTSWNHGAHGNNFPKVMLKLAQERDTLRVINDQTGAPTSADWLAEATARIVGQAVNNPALDGTYHMTASGETTWYEFAKFILAYAHEHGARLKVRAEDVAPIATDDYPTPAKRPHNSRLNTSKLQSAFGFIPPSWQDGVVNTLQQIIQKPDHA